MEDRIAAVFSRFKGEESELISVLQAVQEELDYLPAEAMRRVAKFLRVSEATVFGTATFYAQFYLTRQGKCQVKVCRGIACHVRGGARILREVEKKLGIKPRQTTPDYVYSLDTVACIGACALAPIMTINKDTFGQMTSAKVAEVLGEKMKDEEHSG
jgi:NADH:ubiquinone oxidoreductase subunit E